jgi:plasmid maintenance system antidote protein VapI
MKTEPTLASWLEGKYLAWRANQDRKNDSLSAFARYLKVSQPLIDALVNNRRMRVSQETADKIAAKLGDEIYDLVDLPRPDPDLKYVEMHWEVISPDIKKSIRTIAERAVKKYESRSSAPASGLAAPDET